MRPTNGSESCSAAQQCGSLRNAALAALNTAVLRSAAAALPLHSLH
jgi:hypothetical protein